ncbi:MAG: DUF1573 domain-containing protein, partial [Paramuribaculum sp.]|nr:DUF1573 domain-containing protein [Paramuribaculum sp.]
STYCTTCRMKLPEWDRAINGFMSNDNVDVAFLMILNTRNYNDVNTTLNHYWFNHPVMFDSIGAFMELNSLPDETMYHTLLLDADDRIVAVGNPALNPKIRDIYFRIINGEEKIDAPNLCPEPVTALGVIGAGDTIVKRFALNNRTATALTIQEIVPSCDCVSAVASSGVIQPDSTAMVTVTFVPDSVSGYLRRHIDIFYVEKENPERITLHGFIL